MEMNSVIPVNIHSVHDDTDGRDILPDLGMLFNEFFIGVAEIVLLDNVERIVCVKHHWESVSVESSEDTFHSEAFSFICKAPVLDVISDLAPFAFIVVLECDIKESFSSIGPVFIGW